MRLAQMRLALIVPTLAVLACAQPMQPAPALPGPDACGASELQHLVGEDESVFAAMTFPQGTRFIPPNSAITLDHNPARLNFDLDESGRITRVWCG